jgi:hypothetical protein
MGWIERAVQVKQQRLPKGPKPRSPGGAGACHYTKKKEITKIQLSIHKVKINAVKWTLSMDDGLQRPSIETSVHPALPVTQPLSSTMPNPLPPDCASRACSPHSAVILLAAVECAVDVIHHVVEPQLPPRLSVVDGARMAHDSEGLPASSALCVCVCVRGHACVHSKTVCKPNLNSNKS